MKKNASAAGADGGAPRLVAGPVEEVVLGPVAGDLGLDEGPHVEEVEADARGTAPPAGTPRSGMVWPESVQEIQGGMMRRAPSSQPMYQSGCTA